MSLHTKKIELIKPIKLSSELDDQLISNSLSENAQSFLYQQASSALLNPNQNINVSFQSIKILNILVSTYSYPIDKKTLLACFSLLDKNPEISKEISNIILLSLSKNAEITSSFLKNQIPDFLLQLVTKPFHSWIKDLLCFLCQTPEICDRLVCYGLINHIEQGFLSIPPELNNLNFTEKNEQLNENTEKITNNSESIFEEKISYNPKDYICLCFSIFQTVAQNMKYNDMSFLKLISLISSFFYGNRYPIDQDVITSGLSVIIEILKRNDQKGDNFSPLILQEILHISDFLLNNLQNLNLQMLSHLISILTFLTKSNYAHEIVHLNSFQNLLEAQREWGDSMNEPSGEFFKCLSYLIMKEPETINALGSFGIMDHAIFVFDNGSYKSRINSGYFFVSLANQSFWKIAESFFASNEIVAKLGYLLEIELSNDIANIFAYGLNQIVFNLLNYSNERNESLIQQFCSNPFEGIFSSFFEIENQIVAQSIHTLHDQICSLIPQYPFSIHFS